MDKKGISQVVVMFIVMAVVALVLIFSLRGIPDEISRIDSCEPYAGNCYEGSSCPSGTNPIPDKECPDNKRCCIGVTGNQESSPATSRPAASESEDQQSISELQTQLETARQEGNLDRISAGYDAAKALIIARFAQYTPTTSISKTRENTPFDYNTVKSFEQLTLAQEAAFRMASEDRQLYAASQDYFKWMCRDWLLLTRAHLLGYYEESTYGLDNWLQNKDRVFRDYASHIGTSRDCALIRPITTETDFEICKDSWSDESFRLAALTQETQTEEVWGSCYTFREILDSVPRGPGHLPLYAFQRDDFRIDGTDFFLPRTLQQIFTEAS